MAWRKEDQAWGEEVSQLLSAQRELMERVSRLQSKIDRQLPWLWKLFGATASSVFILWVLVWVQSK